MISKSFILSNLILATCYFQTCLFAESDFSSQPEVERETLESTEKRVAANEHELLAIIEKQLVAIRKGEIERAYNEFTSKSFRKSTSLEEFTNFVKKHEAVAKNKSFQAHYFYFDDGIATFQGTLTSTEGKESTVEYDFIHEDGKWFLFGLQIFQQELAEKKNAY